MSTYLAQQVIPAEWIAQMHTPYTHDDYQISADEALVVVDRIIAACN